jgi:hypothetical protein
MQGGWGLFRGGVLNSTKIDRFMRAFYSDQFVLPLPAGHRFPMPKYRRLRDRLALEVPEVDMQVAAPATDGADGDSQQKVVLGLCAPCISALAALKGW